MKRAKISPHFWGGRNSEEHTEQHECVLAPLKSHIQNGLGA